MATQQKKQSMFCKVCYDAKKKEHTSHNVRDRSGKVVCPTLLSQKCKYCAKTGHTRSYCPALKEGKQQSPAVRQAPAPAPAPEQFRERARRLCESPPPPSLSDNFPIIGQTNSGKIVRPAPVKLNVWATVVAKYRPEQHSPAVKQAPTAEPEQAPAIQKSKAPEPEEITQEQAPVAEPEQEPIEPRYVPESYSGCWAEM